MVGLKKMLALDWTTIQIITKIEKKKNQKNSKWEVVLDMGQRSNGAHFCN